MDYIEAMAIFAKLIKEIDFLKLTATKDYSALKLKPIREDAKKVGEMNTMEKAVFALLALKVEEWHKKYPNTAHEFCQAHFGVREGDEIEKQVYILNHFGLQLIEDRLNLHNHAIIICAECEIVDRGYGRRCNITLY